MKSVRRPAVRTATAALALALVVGASPAAMAWSPAQDPLTLPYDARRGVFSFAGGLERSLPAVVQVTTLGGGEGPTTGDGEPKPLSGGSGVIIDAAAGIIVTNHHVIEGGEKFTVDLTDGRLFDAELVGADKATDLAVLRISAPDLAQVEVVDSDTLRTGDLAFAVGYPLGLDQTLTMGVVSGLNRSGLGDAVEDYIQTDAAVNSGNSGGPLLDSRGRLIGINTSILSGGGDLFGLGGGNDGIAFAVPARIMMYVVERLRAEGEVRRGRIGATLGSLNARRARELGLGFVRGAVIEDVAPGSPADRAGLRRGDIITRIQNRPVANAGSVQAVIGVGEIGGSLSLTYLRDGRTLTTEVAPREPVADRVLAGSSEVAAFGAVFALAVDGSGVVVMSVQGGLTGGLVAGDRVLEVDGREITGLAGLAERLRASR
ncbi:MAG: S1C family serine protease, partial [Brevundimonas sp.]